MNKGFTLIELLVVVLIVGILSAVALPQYTTAVEKSRATEALNILASWHQSAERYRLLKNRWPENANKLDVEMPNVSSEGTLVEGKNYNFSATTSGNAYIIIAIRKTNANKYNIILTASPNGTFTRSCQGTSDKAVKYCNAISDGSPTNF